MPAFRGHDSARKFHCDVPGCSASFIKRAHLRRHEMTHTQRRDFSCPGCNRAFSRNDSMARHLRRKHPHLYRSQEAASSAATGVDTLYTGSIPGVSAPSTSISSYPPTSGYSLLSLRSPFDNIISSPVQPRSEESRSLPDPLGLPSGSSDVYSREAGLHSPKGASSAEWRSSRLPESSHSAPGVSSSDAFRAYPNRFNYSIKEDPDASAQFGSPPLFPSTAVPVDRTHPTRRPPNEHGTHLYRSNMMQAPPGHCAGATSERSVPQSQAPLPFRFPWERQLEEVPYVHPGGSVGWTGAESSSNGATVQSLEHGRRDFARAGYPDFNYAHTPMPSGLTSTAMSSSVGEPSTEAALLYSEFFVEAMRPRGDELNWANLDPCMLIAQSAERVRVESGPEPIPQYSDATLHAPGLSVSPTAGSATAADTYFAVDVRGLCEQNAPAEPPNAGQVEQIMAELGIDFCASQGTAPDASQSFSAQEAYAQPSICVSAAPLIPSQGEMSASSWAPDRFAPIAPGFQLPSQSQSQAHSSQSSIYLPSLTASQNEFLGPNASSHRRPMERVLTSASVAFDSSSQARTSHRRTPSLVGDFDECLGRSVAVSGDTAEPQENSAVDTASNFHEPHDSSLSQRAAQDEEGGRKSACVGANPQETYSSPAIQPSVTFQDIAAMTGSRQGGQDAMLAVEASTNASVHPPTFVKTESGAIVPPAPDDSQPIDSNDKTGMEIDEPPLPQNAQQRNSSASIATSAVSGDQLQLVVDRFRNFAQLCQDHMHPSAEMLDCLAPLIPKVIHADAPFFHPKMIFSQKAHSPEEAFALLSLASLRCDEPHLKKEGYRLVCFLFGLVMLTYKHTLHLGSKLQSFLNCFLVVGMHGMRQSTPDLWQKFEENRESILLDVLKAETRKAGLDASMDRIETSDLRDLPDEDLFLLWSRWYEHESRKRTLLLCAILDSQSSSHFSPFKIDISARPEGPCCQFLFAHVHEPCPDTVFLSWPPKTWATRLGNSFSLPSAKAEIAFHDGQPVSIAACLTERLLRPHVAHVHGPAAYPHFRSSFDFGAGSYLSQSSKLMQSGGGRKDNAQGEAPAPFVEVAEAANMSARTSRRQSHAEGHEEERDNGQVAPEARIVSQLYMLALLEAVHGAWMADSGWYQTPAWGATALPEHLDIDVDDFDPDRASLSNLPGWRVGRTLHATQVAHALMNWSEMFSGWNDGCKTKANEPAAKLGLKVTDDAHQSTIRWQAIFLGLCAPLKSLCFYLDISKRSDDVESERHRRISLLLSSWAETAYCRRALVHAGTILTLLCAAKTRRKKERLGPATSQAVYMSLVVLIGVCKILGEKAPPKSAATNHTCEELSGTQQVWTTLLKQRGLECQKGDATDSAEAGEDDFELNGGEEWLRVRFWHRKFQFLGLAGIFPEQGQEGSHEMYADWRMSLSTGAGARGSAGLLRAAHLRPRWSSFVGDGRWPGSRRETIHVQHVGSADDRRSSKAHAAISQTDPDRDMQLRHVRNTAASTNAWTETRRWVLKGATRNATFCGLAIWRAERMQEVEPSSIQERRDAPKVLKRDHLRELVMWVRDDNPAWCFSQEYTSLLLAALQEPEAAGNTACSSTTHNHQLPTVEKGT